MTFTTVAQIEAAETKDLIAFYNSINSDKPVKKFADRATAIKRCSALIEIQEADAAPVEPQEVESSEAEAEGDKKFVWPFAHISLSTDKAKSAPAEKTEKPAVTKAQAALLREIARSDYTNVNGAEPKVLQDIGWVWSNTSMPNAATQKAGAAMAELGLVELNGQSGEDACVTLTQAGFDAYKALPEGYGVVMATKKAVSHASNAAGVAASWTHADVAAARLTRNGVSVTVDGKTTEHKSTRDAFREYRLLDSKHIRFRGILKAEKTATYTENGVSYLFKII